MWKYVWVSKKEKLGFPGKEAGQEGETWTVHHQEADTAWTERHRSSQQGRSQGGKKKYRSLNWKCPFYDTQRYMHRDAPTHIFASHIFQDTCFMIQAMSQKGNKAICRKHNSPQSHYQGTPRNLLPDDKLKAKWSDSKAAFM